MGVSGQPGDVPVDEKLLRQKLQRRALRRSSPPQEPGPHSYSRRRQGHCTPKEEFRPTPDAHQSFRLTNFWRHGQRSQWHVWSPQGFRWRSPRCCIWSWSIFSSHQGLGGQVQELKLQNGTLEKERLFYFDKLREIEFLLQARQVEQQQSNNLGQDILKILYASEDEKVAIDNEGMLTITAPDGTISASGAPEAETIEEPAQAQEEAEQEGDADMEENTA